MKSIAAIIATATNTVALFTRAWIEICYGMCVSRLNLVALFTRAWIEIPNVRKCKYYNIVALFTRAWIEITIVPYVVISAICRPLYEGVD